MNICSKMHPEHAITSLLILSPAVEGSRQGNQYEIIVSR